MNAKLMILLTVTVFLLLAVSPIHSALGQDSGTVVSVVPSQTNAKQTDKIALNITITNVQNLFAVDVTVRWNASALQGDKATNFLGVETYPQGILHEASGYPINIIANDFNPAGGEYHLAATSQGSATPFSGSGTIASISFTIVGIGQTNVTLSSELADHPEPGEANSEPIAHSDVGAIVNAEIVPEFPEVALLVILLVCVTVVFLSQRLLFKQRDCKRT